MRAVDLDRHLRELGTWVDWPASVDTFKAGDPDTEVTGIAVAWQSQWPALKAAHAAGCNLFVTHEPTYYEHLDTTPGLFAGELLDAKRRWLADEGMVVYRCHDVWDVVPDIGVHASWLRGLGITGPALAGDRLGYHGLYRVSQQSVDALARRLLGRLAGIGQDHLQLLGDGNRVVRHLGVGTGAACSVPVLAAMRGPGGVAPDALLVADDGIRYWGDGEWAVDADLPLLVVNHGTAEEWGMRSLARHLRARFPEVPVQHLPQGCQYRTVAA